MTKSDDERLKFWYGAGRVPASGAANANGTKSAASPPATNSAPTGQSVIDFSGRSAGTGESSPRLKGTLKLPNKPARST